MPDDVSRAYADSLDALAMLQGFIGAQQGRLEGGKYLDWLTMGSVSGLWEGMESRTQAMLEDPGVYSIANWLTMGLLDLAEGALNPNKPLSLEHWLSSLGLASALFGMYEAAKQAIALRKDNATSSGRLDADQDDAPLEGKSGTQLKYNPTSGVSLKSTPGKTTTILGTYADDTGNILNELGNTKSMDFGSRDGGFNLLNTPDEIYNQLGPDGFWNQCNKP